jgi:hypothetical protein
MMAIPSPVPEGSRVAFKGFVTLAVSAVARIARIAKTV